MAPVKKFVFDHHLERLQRIREELERTLDAQHRIDNGHTANLKEYWLASEREKNLLRYEVSVRQWQREKFYIGRSQTNWNYYTTHQYLTSKDGKYRDVETKAIFGFHVSILLTDY